MHTLTPDGTPRVFPMLFQGIAVRPTPVGVLDFQSRFPGDSTAAEFAQRGQA